MECPVLMTELEILDVDCSDIDTLVSESDEIPILYNSELVYESFYKRCMLTNYPCVIKNICKEWISYNEWVVNDTINWDYFIDNYGELEAPVADCDKLDFNAQCKSNMKVRDFMEYLKSEKKQKLLYLKDWHLKAKLRELKLPDNFYTVPKYFASDWLNEYAEDKQEDDFKFVYIGSKDTWTPLHVDVYSSYSWSVNVSGRKKWVLFPPGEEEKLKDSFGNLPILFNTETYDGIKYFEVIQERGDAIFVPSGWHHQVFNLYDTISINHNFINSCNIEKVWNALQKTLTDVEKEIEEFKESPDFTSQCQLILKSLFGMDFYTFIKFIIHIAEKRLNQIQGKKFTVFNSYTFGNNHLIFDLNILYKILNVIENHSLFINNSFSPDILSQHQEVKNNIFKVIN